MRIHSVEMVGFGPFLAPQRVDFEAFADHGIFLIQGRTGAGKSSVLDAVVYALYNSAPRYGTRAADQLRSHHCGPSDPTWVELEFTVGRERYRLRRSPEFERPKSRGEGLTTERAAATLWRADGGEWVALEASPRTVAQRLDDLLPFNLAQFLQVVMLAQGQFERFLVAESAERRRLLSKLFDTQRFDDLDTYLQERVTQRRVEIERAVSTSDTLVATLAGHLDVDAPEEVGHDWLEEVVARCASDEATAAGRRAESHQVLDRRRAEVEAARDLRRRQVRLTELLGREAALHGEREQVEHWRHRLERAGAARAVRSSRLDRQRAGRRLADAEEQMGKASALHAEVFGHEAPEGLDQQRDSLVAAIPTLERAARAEAQLGRATAELEQGRRELDEHQRRIALLAEESTLHRAVVARPLEAEPEEVERAVHELLAEVARAGRLAQAREAREKAERAALAAGERRTRASAGLDDLRRRSMEQVAGRLAADLVDGEACQVCGATAHPAPAQPVGDQVSQSDLDAAQETLDAAQAACLRAEADLAAAREQERVHAGPLTLERARTLLTEATERQSRVREAVAARARAEEELARAERERQEAEVAVAALTATQESRSEGVEELRHEVELARGGAESVAERLEGVRGQLDVVNEVLASIRVLDQAVADHVAATARLDADLASHGFASAQEAEEADLPADVVTDAQERVRAHDAESSVVRAALAEPQMQGLPTDLVDLSGPEEALRVASEEYDLAAAAAGVARQRHQTAREMAARIVAAWSEQAEDRREFDVLRRLAATVHGESPNTRRLRLESYVLAVELDQIVRAANRRLGLMSEGRYELVLDDRVATRGNNAGLGVRVLDQHTQEGRAPESLSGGEKFLASLALALGLAEVVTERAGGVTLDTLFIDEGFGSLDVETLDLAMHALDQLREHGRTVGVISHVEAMKERVPAQLVVECTAGGWSTVRTVV
ncbi:SMC family ATPase [Nocardioides sp. Y6]|uniref:Nuclease SbcCD subunit C n=1 Tax=Nocardioides malaquae TaxID=2773426 RepID=A0ABR9RSE6_9ACTN|nr:SMC family ATPase [Nocardioides malaquae]MBE7324305.1 SMC family ATPase [Nocardioides malaquae]